MIGGSVAAVANYGTLRSIPMDAEIVGETFTLRWSPRADVEDYTLERVNPDGSAETPIVLPGAVSSVTVGDLQPGSVYEWRIEADLTSGWDAYGVLRGGIEVALDDDRGRVLICVSSEMLDPLAAELDRLLEDMAGDGWRPQLVPVPTGSAPTELKATIVAEHAESPLEALLLLGSIPVPYSGAIAPDSHNTHYGAWPADVYYGDVDGEWTDTWRVNTSGNWSRNHNVVGDGKFDQSSIPSDVDLMVGRVDLSDLPAFAPATETDLLRSYLDRDHAFRHAQTPVPRRAIIDDHLNNLSEAVAATARSGFASAVGRTAVLNRDWPDVAGDGSYLLGAGFGYASWASINGVATSATLAESDASVVFSLFFGSYFGDWDNSDNILRAAIAGEGATLASGFNGRPQWQLHGLGLGEPLGAIARESQNAASGSPYYTSYYSRSVHVALHGDPTLRLFPRSKAGVVSVVRDGSGNATLNWAAAPASPDLVGYHIYQAPSMGEPFVRLNADTVTGTNFADPSPLATEAIYQVRAIYREVTGSGSFINSSQGVFATLPELPKIEVVESTTLAREGGNPAVFEVKRTGDQSVALVAQLDFRGSADLASDFPGAMTQVSFPSGESTAWVAISAAEDGLHEGAEELIVSVASSADGSHASGAAEVCVTVYDQGYGEWAELWFGHEAPEPALGGEVADPDRDGVANLVEYAVGSSPVEGGTLPLEIRGTELVDKIECRSYVVRRSSLASGVVLSLETSADLVTWAEAEDVVVRQHTIDSATFETEFLVPQNPVPKRLFVRLVAGY